MTEGALAARARRREQLSSGNQEVVNRLMRAIAQYVDGQRKGTFGYRFAETLFQGVLDGANDRAATPFSLVPADARSADVPVFVLWELVAEAGAVALVGATPVPATSDAQRDEARRLVEGMLEKVEPELPTDPPPSTGRGDVLDGETWPAWTARTITRACKQVGVGEASADEVGQTAGWFMLGYGHATAGHPYDELLPAYTVAHAVEQLAKPGTPQGEHVTGLVMIAEEMFQELPRTDPTSTAMLDRAGSQVLRVHGMTEMAKLDTQGRLAANRQTRRTLGDDGHQPRRR